MKQMKDYMNQQANIVYGGPPLKAPPTVFVRPKPKANGDPSVHPQLVSRRVDAQTQTSFEQTRFPFELVTPKIFEESFGDISTPVSYGGGEMIFDDPSTMSRSHFSIADLTRNVELYSPGPSRGDRGSLMVCCVCRTVYPEDHRVTCCWRGKTRLCFYRCAGPHARYYCQKHPDRR